MEISYSLHKIGLCLAFFMTVLGETIIFYMYNRLWLLATLLSFLCMPLIMNPKLAKFCRICVGYL